MARSRGGLINRAAKRNNGKDRNVVPRKTRTSSFFRSSAGKLAYEMDCFRDTSTAGQMTFQFLIVGEIHPSLNLILRFCLIACLSLCSSDFSIPLALLLLYFPGNFPLAVFLPWKILETRFIRLKGVRAPSQNNILLSGKFDDFPNCVLSRDCEVETRTCWLPMEKGEEIVRIVVWSYGYMANSLVKV